MTEWYIYMENGQPLEVILGRREAFTRLLTSHESQRKMFRQYIERIPDLHISIALGPRSITRVIGPGTEV
jgi:hypothetical protein